ncbi:hypothetical protein F183_A19140 [Bryobacterales bacterium F-183]|nr:hypothetical protein F183_A19140 [Bryobacterales bacterium F-183]
MRKLLLPLLLATSAAALAAAAPQVELGEINGAKFRIDKPENWNGGLVMYCHGYNPAPQGFNDKPSPMLDVFLSQGYAVAQSGYAAGGWAVQEALVDTENLRRYFIKKHGPVKETYVTGQSMGGFLTMAMLETQPTVYDAGMPLCGPLASSVYFLSRGAFDGLVLFHHFFPGVLPEPGSIPSNYTSTRELTAKVEAELNAAEKKAASLRSLNDIKNNRDMAGVLTFLTYLVKELTERAGGNPFDNRNVIYHHTGDDNAVNASIKRYTADPKAIEYLRTYYTPTGRLSRPMLAIHTSYDPLVPTWIPNTYQSLTDQAGSSNLFVQQYVKRDGHCTITPQEISKGFSQLRQWKANGVRPSGGDQASIP